MRDELTKAVKKKLRELAYKAHEAALRRELPELVRHVESWQRGEIDSIGLCDRVHKFDSGPIREIYLRFTYTSPQLPILVAHGVATGLLDEHAIPAEVRPHIATAVAFFRENA